MAESDEEDDYMNMVFDDAPKQPTYETSLQRAARKRKEVQPRHALSQCPKLTRYTGRSEGAPEVQSRARGRGRGSTRDGAGDRFAGEQQGLQDDG